MTNDPFISHLGRVVRLFREARGWNQESLAARCAELGYSITQSHLSRVENGRHRDLTLRTIREIAAALGTTASRLLVEAEVAADLSTGAKASRRAKKKGA